MSRSSSVSTVGYETSAEIARRAGYSRDYVSRLARGGKVQAMKVGRTWLIDPESFQSFVMSRRSQRQAGVVVLSTAVTSPSSPVPAMTVVHTTPVVLLNTTEHIWLQTVAVVLCGCMLGVIGWFGQQNALGIGDLQQGAVAVVRDWETQLVPPALHASVATTRSLPALLMGAVSQATK